MRRILAIISLILIWAGIAVAKPQMTVSPQIAWQGKVISVKVCSLEGAVAVGGRFLGQDFTCYQHGAELRGIVGVPINQKPGHYDLDLFITRRGGQIEKITRVVKVWATKFPFSRYWLKPHKKKLLAPKLVNRDWARIEPALLKERTEQLWQGRFIRPVTQEVSQGFGHRQIVNGKRSGNHRGVDFASPIGTPVRAPNRGKVVFRQYLEVFGGTMVIDHGQGVQTLYYHLSKCYSEVGQMVEKGEVIALTGHSGVSSGPHLHWGMSIHNLRVDPLQWTKYEL